MPCAPTSQLQTFVEALVDASVTPTIESRTRGLDETELEMWLLGRACSSAVVLATGLFPDVTPAEIAAEVSRREELDGFRAAFAEDCLVELSKGRNVDPTRLMRADTHELMAGFMYVTAGLARVCSERLGNSAVEVVRVCFSAADGSLMAADHPWDETDPA